MVPKIAKLIAFLVGARRVACRALAQRRTLWQHALASHLPQLLLVWTQCPFEIDWNSFAEQDKGLVCLSKLS